MEEGEREGGRSGGLEPSPGMARAGGGGGEGGGRELPCDCGGQPGIWPA